MALVIFFAVVLTYREFMITRSGGKLSQSFDWLVPSRRFAHAAAFALPFLYLARIVIFHHQALQGNTQHRYAWMNDLPLPVFNGWSGSYDPFVSAASFTIGVFETFALVVVVLALRNGVNIRNRYFFAICIGLALISLLSPVMSSTDPYEYVATGILGFASYAPLPASFDHSIYAKINIHIPLQGVIYGPLWVVVDTLQTSLGSTILAKIEALKITNIIFICAFIRALACSSVPRVALVAIAINPVLWDYTVATPHADIQGLTLLAFGLFFARRSKPVLATAALVLAGLMKLPFVITGGVILYSLQGAKRRALLWTIAILLVLALSYSISGGSYVADVSKYAVAQHTEKLSKVWLWVSSIVFIATLSMVAFRRGYLSVALIFPQAGPIEAPWYLYWGIPYALVAGSSELYFAAMPLAATMLDNTLQSDDVIVKYLLILLCLLLVEHVSFRKRATIKRLAAAEDLHLVTMQP